MYQELLARLIEYHNDDKLYRNFRLLICDYLCRISGETKMLIIDNEIGIVKVFKIMHTHYPYNSDIMTHNEPKIKCIHCGNNYHITIPLNWINLCPKCLYKYDTPKFERINSKYQIKFRYYGKNEQIRYIISTSGLHLWYKNGNYYRRESVVISNELTNLSVINSQYHFPILSFGEIEPQLHNNQKYTICNGCGYKSKAISNTQRYICNQCFDIILNRNLIQTPFIVDKILPFCNFTLNNDVKFYIIKILISVIF